MKILLCMLLLLPFFSGGSLSFAGTEQCVELINKRCTECHYKSRICTKLGKKNTRGWRRSVNNMIRYGAKLNSEERNIIIDCLDSAPAGADFACKN